MKMTPRLLSLPLALLSLVHVAFADQALDTLQLRDGTILRGQAGEIAPGRFVRFQLLTGEVRVVEASAILASEGPSFSRPALPATTSALALPGQVRVELRSVGGPQAVSLIGGRSWGHAVHPYTWSYDTTALCTTPCSFYASPGPLRLFASGDGILNHCADVDVPKVGVELTLRAPRMAWSASGAALVSLGAITTCLGGVLGGVGLHQHPDGGGAAASPVGDRGMTIGGLSALGLGLVAATVGVVLLAKSRGGVASARSLALGAALRGKIRF